MSTEGKIVSEMESNSASIPPPIPEESVKKSQLKTLQKENKALKAEVRKLEHQFKHVEAELIRSNDVRARLENLCRELRKQSKFIKEESTNKLEEAHTKGKELAAEVQNNMKFMKSINDNLATITTENMKVKLENEELQGKLDLIKSHYEKREAIIQEALKETSDSCLAAQRELAELKLKNAEEKEKLYTEMQQLASTLVSTREQLKEAKGTELQLRNLLQSYESKFNGLQVALKETNSAYQSFRSEMAKVTKQTKELEAESQKWKMRWEESQESFAKLNKSKLVLESELKQTQDGLGKMTELCRALQDERKQMLTDLKRFQGSAVINSTHLANGPPAVPLAQKAAQPQELGIQDQIDKISINGDDTLPI